MNNYKKFINKIGIIFFMTLVFGVLGCVEGYAATIGQQLTQPEQGWKRYDDTDGNISYNGNWNITQESRYWMQTAKWASCTGNESMKFNFIGSKVRITAGTEPSRGSNKVKIKIDGVYEEYVDFSIGGSNYQTLVFEKTDLNNIKEHYVELFSQRDDSKYLWIDAIDIDENGELKPYTEKVTTEEAITVESPKNKYKVGNEFTTDIVLHNGTNICAEDLKISYDKDLFEYVGIEQVEGIKAVKEFKDPTNGQIRLITASLGKQNAVNGDKALVKLKFRGKKQGKGKVDVTKARIANNGTIEKDILEENCGEKEIEIEGIKDVNRTGEFTLLDLAVDGWYYGDKAENTDKTKFDTDVVENGMIDDDDLLEIGKFMLENPNYEFNK